MAGRLVRSARPRTHATIAHEELGLALGRLAMSYPAFREALLVGFSRAIREHVAGAVPGAVDRTAAELAEAGAAVARVHGVAKNRAKTAKEVSRGK